MVNNTAFSERLKKVLEYYQLSASAFADSIQVQRSSISHLLSGRNKPSLDFVLKVLSIYKEVELYWLLNGKGTFPKEAETQINKNLHPTPPLIGKESIGKEEVSNMPKEIERIIVFFKDGTFKNYME